MRLPSLSVLKDKWVLLGLAAGAGVYLFTQHKPVHHVPVMPHHMPRHGTSSSRQYEPVYDRTGLYETGVDFNHMRFSGQAVLQHRLSIA